MRIIIADDHPMIQKGLSLILRDLGQNIETVPVFDGETLIDQLKNQVFDLLIMDINMPSMSFQQFEFIVERYPELKVLVYSQNPEKQFAIRYLKAGAKGYVEKSSPDEVLLAAIRKVKDGGSFYSSDVMDVMMEQIRGNHQSNPFLQLSNREYDVALLLLNGRSIQDISNDLHLSPSTVSTYKVRLFEKLNVSSPLVFVQLAKDYGVI